MERKETKEEIKKASRLIKDLMKHPLSSNMNNMLAAQDMINKYLPMMNKQAKKEEKKGVEKCQTEKDTVSSAKQKSK